MATPIVVWQEDGGCLLCTDVEVAEAASIVSVPTNVYDVTASLLKLVSREHRAIAADYMNPVRQVVSSVDGSTWQLPEAKIDRKRDGRYVASLRSLAGRESHDVTAFVPHIVHALESLPQLGRVVDWSGARTQMGPHLAYFSHGLYARLSATPVTGDVQREFETNHKPVTAAEIQKTKSTLRQIGVRPTLLEARVQGSSLGTFVSTFDDFRAGYFVVGEMADFLIAHPSSGAMPGVLEIASPFADVTHGIVNSRLHDALVRLGGKELGRPGQASLLRQGERLRHGTAEFATPYGPVVVTDAHPGQWSRYHAASHPRLISGVEVSVAPAAALGRANTRSGGLPPPEL